MKQSVTAYRQGMRDAIPIGAGYLAVSFTLGIAAKKTGIGTMAATIMSLTNNTSAGQFAALSMIASSASYLELAASQFIINIRYLLMSFALSQKLDPSLPLWKRMLLAYGVTDEIFGISIRIEGTLNPFYTYGAISVAAPGWALGTLLGSIAGDILPVMILNALGVALYGMFLAVVIPQAKKDRTIAILVILSFVISLVCSKLPFIGSLSSGSRMILLTVLISLFAAIFFPVADEERKGGHES